jgi:DNA topoisomerase-2
MFEQVSIVNGISTYREGTHINYIVNKLSNELLEQILKGNKKIKLRIQDIKNKLFIFLICKIPNPSFDTQTKEYLSTKMTKEITQDCEISQQTIKKIMKSHIVESILE